VILLALEPSLRSCRFFSPLLSGEIPNGVKCEGHGRGSCSRDFFLPEGVSRWFGWFGSFGSFLPEQLECDLRGGVALTGAFLRGYVYGRTGLAFPFGGLPNVGEDGV